MAWEGLIKRAENIIFAVESERGLLHEELPAGEEGSKYRLMSDGPLYSRHV